MSTNALHTEMLGQFAEELDPPMRALLGEARGMRDATAGHNEELQERHWGELQVWAINVAGVVLAWQAIGVGFDELAEQPVRAGLVRSSCQLFVLLRQHREPCVRDVDRTLDGLWSAALGV